MNLDTLSVDAREAIEAYASARGVEPDVAASELIVRGFARWQAVTRYGKTPKSKATRKRHNQRAERKR